MEEKHCNNHRFEDGSEVEAGVEPKGNFIKLHLIIYSLIF
jgi:hypothetical protein